MSTNIITIDNASIDERLKPIALESWRSGYRVFMIEPIRTRRTTGFIYICEDINGPFVTVSIPTNRFEPLSVGVPVKPNREWGSSVHVGEEDTPTMDAVHEGVAMDQVKIRYIDSLPNTFVKNYGRKVLDGWKAHQVIEVTE